MIVRAQFPDLFLTSMLPALEELIWQKFDPEPPCFSKLFRVMSSTKSFEQTTQLSGLGTFSAIPEGGDMVYDQPVQGFDKTYIHTQYGLGFRMTRIMIDDDKFSIAKKNATELGRGSRETLELLTHQVWNNAFTAGNFAGPDGVALCSASHPQIKVGGVQSNVLSAADLDVSSLELALTAYRGFKDSAGKLIRVTPQTLLVAPANEWNAAEILSGSMRSDTANNTVNAFKHRAPGFSSFTEFLSDPYLTDDDSWFILPEKSEMETRFYWREKPTTLHDTDFDSRSVKTAMWMRFSYGFSDYLGIFGVPGA